MSDELVYDPNAMVIVNYNDTLRMVEPRQVRAEVATYWAREWVAERDKRREYAAALDKVREYLVENYDELELHADEIADLLGIELEREVSVRLTIEVTATVTLKAGETLQEAIDGDYFTVDHDRLDNAEVEVIRAEED